MTPPLDIPSRGSWSLELPSGSASIHVRSFTCPSRLPIPQAESSADAIRRAALEAISLSNGEDALEIAWRAINGIEAGDVGQDVKDVLKTPCAVITSGADGSGRRLWLFEVRGDRGSGTRYHHKSLESLTQSEDSVSYSLSDLIKCQKHGQGLDCLKMTSENCKINWEQGKVPWQFFTWAVVEKLAWRHGRRICMQARSRDDDLHSHATLRPITPQHLILSLNSNTSLPIPIRPSGSVQLLPIHLPAIRLSSFTPSSAQFDHLETSFKAALGPTWSKTRLKGVKTEWAVYWVPSMRTAMAVITGGNGVLVVWPDHLVYDGAIKSTSTNSLSRSCAIAPIPSAPALDLMDIASGLFDFFSTYKGPSPPPPEIPPDIPSVDPDLPTPQTGPVFTPKIDDMPDPAQERLGETSEDDLFSSNSNSPLPQLDEVVAGNADDFDALFGEEPNEQSSPPVYVELDRDFEMGSPDHEDVVEDRREEVYEPYEVDENEITADDFAFLDSPNAGVDQEATGADEMEVRDKSVREAEGEVKPVHVDEDPPALPQLETVGIPESLLPDKLENAKPTESQQNLTSPKRDLSLKRKPESDPPQLPIPPSTELIPSLFSPLESIRPTLHPIGGPPTPAPTPESISLRDDLIERLRDAKRQKGDTDYASAWHIEDDHSEVEEEEDDNEAPPTPLSQDSTADDEISISGKSTRGTDGGREAMKVLEWKGLRLIGAEVIWVREDKELWEAISRPWNPDWVVSAALPSPPASPIVKPKVIEGLDLDRLAREIIANRSFRKSLDASQSNPTAEDDFSFLPSTGGLSGILAPTVNADIEAETQTRILGSCNVHAGFAGNIIRLSIASMRYWRQLGLSPAGGEKDVEAVVVTSGEELTAKSFLEGMGTVWSENRLGSHVTKEHGVIKCGLGEVGVKIGELAKQTSQGNDLIIYLLVDDDTAKSQALLQTLSLRYSQTAIIHVVLTTAIQTRQLPDIAFDVYNRIPRSLHRITPSVLPTPPSQSPVSFQYPFFTLAPDQPAKPELTLEWPIRSYDVLNRWRYVHAAYTYDIQSGLVIAFVIDSEGDNYEVRTFETKDIVMSEQIGKIWAFLVGFAEVAAIEWRMSITRVGDGLGREEVDTWRKVLNGQYVTLLKVDLPISSSLSPSETKTVPPPILSDTSARITDDTLTTRTATSTHRIPIALSAKGKEEGDTIYPILSFAISVNTSVSTLATAMYHVISHRAAPGKEDEKVDEVLSRHFQKMTYLGRLRFGFEGEAVGVHVDVVRSVNAILTGLNSG